MSVGRTVYDATDLSPPPPRASARYPEAAGAQVTTTSREAAASVDVSRLRRAVLNCFAVYMAR